MKLIFIYGLPASGKLTVGRELAARTGFRLFHNHLVVDMLLSVFEFGSPSFIELRERLWLSVFEHACQSQLPGLIFTFAPESTVRPDFVRRVQVRVAEGGGEIDFVQLVCPVAVLKQRLQDPARQDYGKLTSLSHFDELHQSGRFDSAYMPEPTLSIDTSCFTPAEAADEIARELGLLAPD